MMKELDALERALHPKVDADQAIQIAEQAIALGHRLNAELNANLLLLKQEREERLREMEKLMRALCDARLEKCMLKTHLRQALRQWLLNTPDVEDVVTVWRMAREADLAQ